MPWRNAKGPSTRTHKKEGALKDLAIRFAGAAWTLEEGCLAGLRPARHQEISSLPRFGFAKPRQGGDFKTLSQKTRPTVSPVPLSSGKGTQRAFGPLCALKISFEAVSKDIRRLRQRNKIMNECHFH
jgi:hypothetical protein